jgi:hypothetical protein
MSLLSVVDFFRRLSIFTYTTLILAISSCNASACCRNAPAALHFFHADGNQALDLARGIGAAFRQTSHLAGHHGDAPSRITLAGSSLPQGCDTLLQRTRKFCKRLHHVRWSLHQLD